VGWVLADFVGASWKKSEPCVGNVLRRWLDGGACGLARAKMCMRKSYDARQRIAVQSLVLLSIGYWDERLCTLVWICGWGWVGLCGLCHDDGRVCISGVRFTGKRIDAGI